MGPGVERAAALALLLILGACASRTGPPAPPLAPTPVAPSAAAAATLEAFLEACGRLPTATDRSGLTKPADWAKPCLAARSTPPADFPAFLARHFTPVTLEAGTGLATGYFVPEYPAFPATAPGLVPALGPPAGLDCARAPCPARAAIMAGALSGRSAVLAWLDPVDLAFLQVQGSGLLRMPDGRLLRLGFGGHNGHPYVAIGRVLRERGELPSGAGMAEIRAWLASHPQARDDILNANPRYIFFRAMDERQPFPVGSLGSRLVAEASVAVDPRHVPAGAIVDLETVLGTGAPFRRLLVAADTGSAITGANRFDIFFGTGPAAGSRAGAQQAPARATIWIPKPAAP